MLARACPEYAEAVAERLAELLGIDGALMEPPVVERLLPGQFVFERHAGPRRTHSALVYLSAVPASVEDGMTDFKHATFQFRPNLPGAAVVWRNVCPDGSLDHRLRWTEMPLTEMTRYMLLCHTASPVAASASAAPPT